MSDRSVVGEKCAHALRRRRQTGQIQRDTANKLRVGAQLRRQGFHLLQLRINEFVDVIVFGHVLPFIAGPITHDGHELGCVTAFIPNEHSRFTAAQARDDGVFDFGNITVVAAQDGVAGHVANASVGVVRQHQHMLRTSGQIEFDLRRQDFNRQRAALGGVLEFRSLRDPFAQKMVFARTGLERLPALVRDLRRWFQQHQTLLGFHAIETAPRQIVDESLIIELRVVTAQGKSEPVLALRRSVTGTGVAAEIAEDRLDVPHKPDVRRDGVFDRHRQPGLQGAEGHCHLGIALLLRANVTCLVDFDVR